MKCFKELRLLKSLQWQKKLQQSQSSNHTLTLNVTRCAKLEQKKNLNTVFMCILHNMYAKYV